MRPEITYALSRLVDGGLPVGFLTDLSEAAVEQGLKVREYSIWFDMGRGPEGTWMVTFKLEVVP